MPKIRGIKPEFWTSDGILELSIPARLLFIGMWNYACDNGHLPDKPRQIKLRLLPADDVKVSELLEEMVAAEQIERSEGWITIPDLSHHQKPHRRWWTTCEKPGCEVPEGASHAPSTRGATVAKPGGNGCATADVDCEVDGDGDGELTRAKPAKRSTTIPKDFTPSDTNRRVAGESRVNIDRALAQFVDHHAAKGSTYKDWHLAFNTWLRRERPDLTSAKPRRLQHAADVEQPPNGLSDEQYDAWLAQRRHA